MRTNIQLDHAQFITKLIPYQESDEMELEYCAVEKLVNFAVVHQPDLPRPIESTFRMYQNRVAMKVVGLPPLKALQFKRGAVSYMFSRKARRRLMNAFHSWQVPEGFKRYHITLTYPALYSPDYHIWKEHLKAFKRRMAAIFPEIEGYWRLELQPKRKAPHYHLMIAIPKGIITNKKLKKIITKEWAKIAHSQDQYEGKYATKVQVIHNDKMAQSYISKYCAKNTPKEKIMVESGVKSFEEQFERETEQYKQRTIEEKTIGRQWGRIGKPCEAPILEYTCSVQDQDLIRSTLALWLERINPNYADKVRYSPVYQSYQVYGMQGCAFALIMPRLLLRVLKC